MVKKKMSPKQLSKAWLAKITRESKQKSAAQAARRRAQIEKQLEAEDRVVAWIDKRLETRSGQATHA